MKIGTSLRLVITGAIFYLIFQRIEWDEFLMLFESIQWQWWGLGLIAAISAKFFAALLNYDSLKAVKAPLPILTILRTNYLSYFVSFLGNFLGSAIRWHGFKGLNQRRGEALFAVVLERFLMLPTALILYFVAVTVAWVVGEELPGNNVLQYCVISVLLLVVVGLIFILHPSPAFRLGQWDGLDRKGWWGFLMNRVSDLLRVLKNFQNHKILFFNCSVYMMAQKLLTLFIYVMAVQALDLNIQFLPMFLVFPLISLAQILPVTVFGLGIREGMLVYYLPAYGVRAEEALALGFFVASQAMFQAVLGGVWFLGDTLFKKEQTA